jgi:hypothetical protein
MWGTIPEKCRSRLAEFLSSSPEAKEIDLEETMDRKGHALIFCLVWIVAFALFSCAKEEKKGAPLKPLPNSGFKAELGVKEVPSEMKKGGKVNVIVTVKNISDQTWPSRGDSKEYYKVDLSYQFLDEGSKPLAMEGERTPLPQDLKPGESIELSAVLKAPDNPGNYTVRFDMVQEGVAWFGWKNKGNYSKPSIISVIP